MKIDILTNEYNDIINYFDCKKYDCIIVSSTKYRIWKVNEKKSILINYISPFLFKRKVIILSPKCTININSFINEIIGLKFYYGDWITEKIKISSDCHIIDKRIENAEKTNIKIKHIINKKKEICGCQVINFYNYLFNEKKYNNILLETKCDIPYQFINKVYFILDIEKDIPNYENIINYIYKNGITDVIIKGQNNKINLYESILEFKNNNGVEMYIRKGLEDIEIIKNITSN